MSKSFLGKGFGVFVIATVGGVGLLLLSVRLAFCSDWAILATVALVIFLLLVPVSLLVAEGSWFQQGLVLRRDLHQGFVKVFSGPLTEADRLLVDDTADPTQYRLLTWEMLKVDNGPQMVEVLPASHRVWQANGERIMPWMTATWKSVAKPSEVVGLQPDHTPLPSYWEGGRRRMSERERAELFREARRHWQGPVAGAFLFSACLVGLLVETLTAHLALKSLPKLGAHLHLLWLVPALDAYALRRWQEARRMSQDAQQGEVEIVAAEDAASGHSERLPVSGRSWNQSGRPAAWRQMIN